MVLNNVDRVIAELHATLAYEGSQRDQIATAKKLLDLISSLQSSDGPEKWIELHGHLTLALYHAPQFVHDVKIKRAIAQVVIYPRHPLVFGEIKYLLPVESRPWEYASGIAEDTSTAAGMIIDSLHRCEQRDEHLHELLG